jgi:hypothetical protein
MLVRHKEEQMRVFRRAVLAAIVAVMIGGTVALASGGVNITPSSPKAAATLKGPCDEAEHANDPKCNGVQVAEDRSQTREHEGAEDMDSRSNEVEAQDDSGRSTEVEAGEDNGGSGHSDPDHEGSGRNHSEDN